MAEEIEVMADEDPLVAGKPKIGILHSGQKDSFARHIEEFKNCLEEMGLDIGEDVIVRDPVWTDDDAAALKDDAEGLVAQPNMKVIVAAGGPASAKAAKAARDAAGAGAANIAIVFTSVVDPGNANVLDIQNLDVPATKITGMAGLTSELDVERLRLLRSILILPGGAKKIGVLRRFGRVNEADWYAALNTAATGLGLTLVPSLVNDATAYADQIRDAFTLFRTEGVLAVVVTADPLFNNKRKLIVRLAADKNAVAPKPLPAIYQWREFVAAGGLMSYGPTMKEAYRHAAKYAAQILAGADVTELPIARPSEFELVFNRKAAKTLSAANLIKIPLGMASRAVMLPPT